MKMIIFHFVRLLGIWYIIQIYNMCTGSTDIGAIEVQQFMKDGSRNVLVSFNIQTFDDKLLSLFILRILTN